MAIDRVRTRVAEGGHNIPENVIIRRYFSGIRNLFDLYIDIVDQVIIFDSSDPLPRTIAFKTKGTDFTVKHTEKFNKL
jgi:predicted ABC-type ATPase